ncbi:dTDP-4-dehydrorhamnose reductase (plasmid) [Shinella sp. WSC3-e]|nr:dTDP-4-dehydrorhamnose reductase [Rhizobiaceae bacterium]CAK7260859.1 dTDP-4-dehydrorhamnose reductase [Shinella sp. WSC3-e]
MRSNSTMAMSDGSAKRGRLFLAGASGAIGTRVIPLLLSGGWHIMGMTRSQERADAMRSKGLDAVVADAFDGKTVNDLIVGFQPDVLMHQLTDLPRDLAKLDEAALERNAKVRKLGTHNLVEAAKNAGVKRLVVQSIAFDYVPETPRPHKEGHQLAGRLPGASATSDGVVSLEDQVSSSGIPFAILRYGRLYGPGTGSDRPWGPAGIHIDAAALATALAARSDLSGIFNITESDGEVDSSRARQLLDWNADWRTA